MLKHLHMTIAVISILLFTFRFFLLLSQSSLIDKKWLKIAPHVIDTLLLVAGISLAVTLSLNPAEQLWLLEKILAIFAYIFTGYYTLKLAKNNAMRIFGYIGALGWIFLIVRIAVTKETVFF